MRTDAIQVRVFVEGVRLSGVGMVSVQTFANETARASFTIPPVPGFETEELKRARVHIFWSDVEIRENSADDDWPVLFEGEIVADGYSKSPTSRNLIFHCAGYHTYWEQVLLYFWDASHPAQSQPVWVQNLAVALGNERFGFEGGVAGLSLRQRMVTELDKNKGVSYQSIVRKIFGDSLNVNHFFRLQDQALKLSKRFVTPNDPNLGLLIGRDRVREGLGQDIGTVNGETPMMEVLKKTLDLFRYQIVHNAQPVLVDDKVQKRRTARQIDEDVERVRQRLVTYLQGLGADDVAVTTVAGTGPDDLGLIDASTSDTNVTSAAKDVVSALNASDQLTDVANQFKTIRDLYRNVSNPTTGGDDKLEHDDEYDGLLSQFLLIPDTRFALPPTCNVIFPQDQTSLSLDRQLMQEPTRGISVPGQESGLDMRLFIAPAGIDRAVVPSQTVMPGNVTGFQPPIKGRHYISSRFQRARTIRDQEVNPEGKTRPHKGLDIAAPSGTDVLAVDDGVVTRAGWSRASLRAKEKGKKKGFGQRVYITHGNGVTTIYAHLSAISVSVGQKVEAGQKIGEVGSTGGSTGPHLHFETVVNGTHENPEKFLTLTANGKQLAPAPPATGTEAVSGVETDERSITAIGDGQEDTFQDYKFLTPEEQRTGIVPFFEMRTARSHAFLTFSGKSEDADSYILQMLEAEYLWRRYQTRSLGSLNMPFNPNPVAGFPGLVVDRNRSIIGNIQSVSHTVSVGGGQGNASSVVQMDAPRYWDEGDPYHWVNGVVADGNPPDPSVANFPAYYLSSLVGSNSAVEDVWWDDTVKVPDSVERPVDRLYSQILGAGVRGIPYQYATRSTNLGTTVAYNKAIAKRTAFFNADSQRYEPTRGGGDKNTIVGRYYYLVDKDPVLAESYVRSMTRRRGISERDLMGLVLQASTADGGQTYSAAAFVPQYQATVRRMNVILGEENVFRG